jgi:hypothetical protein
VEFHLLKLISQLRSELPDFVQGAFVFLFLREFVKGLRVIESALKLKKLSDLALQTRLFRRQGTCLAVVIPETVLIGQFAQLLDPALFDR